MITTKGQKTVAMLATMVGATTLATMGTADEASANTSSMNVEGVYKVDRLVQHMGKWYVVANPLAIPTIDYNNWIPVDPLTVTDANGNRSEKQTLTEGSHFTFSNGNYDIRYSEGDNLSLTMAGEPVWFKKSALSGSVGTPTTKPETTQKQDKPAAPKKQTTNDANTQVKSVNVRQAGINGFYNGGYSYPAAQCTSFVANILAERGVNVSQFQFLGNAESWAANAQARGVNVSMTPRVGSVVSFKSQGWYAGFGHVGYITSVNADGSFQMAEGNFAGKPFHERTVWVNNDIAGIIHF
ncbi:CHAP domain-containing protein [Weissella ceti]|uniref:CHAP domain-containing protein n=1 Tax=Weissella ceti TaxID=759620 RepID=A0ABT3E5H0_9LACO|nr:CHAP domain-containing protein [Weissella ceti]MCW0953158.1 CHAP domain-containing protein [Weissella ceti]QVK12677.1 CHAP domain-containing protein [Weissella ceti]